MPRELNGRAIHPDCRRFFSVKHRHSAENSSHRLHFFFRSLLHLVEGSKGVPDKKEVIAMALTPFRGFWDTQSEMERLFDQMVGDFFGGR